MRKLAAVSTLLLTCVLAVGCKDTTGLGGRHFPPEGSSPDTPFGLVRLDCTASIVEATVQCAETVPAKDPGGPSLMIMGTPYVKLRSSNSVSDTIAEVFSFDATVQNLMGEPIGTPDGTTLTGVRVLFHSGPTATAYRTPGDTGTVTIRNADGYGQFTGPNQPYFLYSQMLQPDEISAAKNWQFNLPVEVTRFSFVVYVDAALPTEGKVPTTAPQNFPAWTYDPANIVACQPLKNGKCVRDLVSVTFKPGTALSSKEAAISYAGGEVVGGFADAGAYWVRVDDDGTLVPIQNAIARLQSRPQVARAVPVDRTPLSTDHIMPVDGPGWNQWKVRPDSADGNNWAPEMIAAPLAWGCSRGDTVVGLAVLDHGFHNVAELTKNVHSGSIGVGAFAGGADHGTRVASAIGAAGNDSTLMTGMMWHARMRLYDVALDTANNPILLAGVPQLYEENVLYRLAQAARGGAAIINMSLGYRWAAAMGAGYNPATETNPMQDSLNRQQVADRYAAFGAVITTLQAENRRPLIIFSAGNDAIDAEWNHYRIAADSFPDQVLVVGSVDASRSFSTSFSNTGHLVQVVAPGENPYLLTGAGTVNNIASGTSFAAPHVTGVAGLLKSFDPRLTAGEMKALIISGAVRGNRRAAGYPVANAYESLRAAAERRGAPLCGNPVYQDTLGNVFARRDSAWTFSEQLFTTADSLPNLLHGGKRARFTAGGGFEWVASGLSASWQARGSLADTITNATGRSKQGLSHGIPFTPAADSAVTVTKTRISLTQERFDVAIGGNVIAQINGPLAQRAQNVRTECIEWTLPGDPVSTCVAYWKTFEDSLTTSQAVAFSPSGDTVVLAISRDSVAQYAVDVIPMGTYSVRKWGQHKRSLETLIYYIPIRGGAVRGPWSHTFKVEALGLSEDGAHLVLQTRDKFFYSQTIDGSTSFAQHNICRGTFARSDGTQLFTLPLRNLGNFGNTRACYPGTTFAP